MPSEEAVGAVSDTVGTVGDDVGELRYDVVVIGAGVAGLVAVIALLERRPQARVAVVDQGPIGSGGSTPLAQGGMAAAVGREDTPARHAEDTIRSGDGLCDPIAVEVLAWETPDRVEDLRRWGARFDRQDDGSLDLSREGGQSVGRSVHHADATGAEMFRALAATARGLTAGANGGGLHRLQGIACDLVVDRRGPRRVAGAWVLLDDAEASDWGPAQAAGLTCVRAAEVVLATGGCGGLYDSTTNREGACGHGVALAHRAGAAVRDMEFVQFHPTGLVMDGPTASPTWRLLLTEALRGAGATLHDADGRRFMPERHPDAELAPRHVVTKGILDQPGGAWLDATGLGGSALATRFPTVTARARAEGYDLAAVPVPVQPVQHYMIGGVATDLWGTSTLPGLSAVGEVASTGVHGANRMAGNSLAQACVFGHRAGVRLASATAPPPTDDAPPPAFATGPPDPDAYEAVRSELRAALSDGAGPIRSAASLARAAAALDHAAARVGPLPASTAQGVALGHTIAVGRLIVDAAARRPESRGVHWRQDLPTSDDRWAGIHQQSTRL